MSLSDPLTLLREFTVEKKPILLEGDHIVFGKTRFDRKAPTAYRAGSAGEYYPIDSLWAILQKDPSQPNVTAGEYVAFCGSQAIKPVGITDRKKLVEYLTGKLAESKSVDYSGYEQPEPVTLEDAAAGLDLEAEKEAAKPKERAELTSEEAAALEAGKAAFKRILEQPVGVQPTEEEAAAFSAASAAAAAAEAEAADDAEPAADEEAAEGAPAAEVAPAAEGAAAEGEGEGGAEAMEVEEGAKEEKAAEEEGGETPSKRKREEKEKAKAAKEAKAAAAKEKAESLERKLLRQAFAEAKPFIRCAP